MAILDKTIDEALIEVIRTKRALEALRKKRKAIHASQQPGAIELAGTQSDMVTNATVLRASMDLTRKLADLRQGR